MFKRDGICYHTGYKPTFHDPQVKEVIPRAIKRMNQWTQEYKAKHKKEDEGRK